MADKEFILSQAPHTGTTESVEKIMFAVVYALFPAGIAGVYIFGPRALLLICVCVFTAMATEYVWQKARVKPISVLDGSVIITGLLLAYTLPPNLPLFMAVLGSVVAVSLGKQIFGGLGHNVFNPALVGRAFVQAAFPVAMATWAKPFAWMSGHVDAVSAATPLGLMKFDLKTTAHAKLFFGNIAGSLGETSALALLLGAAWLFYKGYIEWRIPGSFIGSVAVVGGTLWVVNPERYPDPLFSVLAGGLLLGAFFMATDYASSPITPTGKLIFGAGAGSLLVIIRTSGGLAEGVMYAILLMNALTPLINRYTQPRVYGTGEVEST